jgi:hypothetical protein
MARVPLTLARLWPLAFGLWAATLGSSWLRAQSTGPIESSFFDGTSHPAVGYNVRARQDPVARLKQAIESGQTTLAYEPGSGYLRAVLRALDIHVDTQLAVFSQTSLQSLIITPANPRTIYFNDSGVVAWPRGGIIELAAQDPELGLAFYTLVSAPARRRG